MPLLIDDFFFCWNVLLFSEKNLGKNKILCHNFSFSIKSICKNPHNCLQYERVLKISYFHILNIAKFG